MYINRFLKARTKKKKKARQYVGKETTNAVRLLAKNKHTHTKEQ